MREISVLFEVGMEFWNTIVGVAMSYFLVDPLNGHIDGFEGQVALIRGLTTAVSAVAVPVVALFFLLALVKDLAGTKPDMMAVTFFGGLVKYGIVVALVGSPLWLMQNVSEAASSVVSTVGGRVSLEAYEMDISQLDVDAVQKEVDEKVEAIPGIAEIITTDATWGDFFSNAMSVVLSYVVFFLAGAFYMFIALISAVQVLNVALHRVLKPLVILPFVSVAMATAAGSYESRMVMVSFVKTYVGFVLSGAAMVICISFGATMAGYLAVPIAEAAEEYNLMGAVMGHSVAMLMTPVLVAGMVKGADSLVSEAMG